ncbi:MAG TPA: glycosyltransferase [Alphaproteobacteria bacterium]|jgi:glycosyltransferase involved in cell wall biosynthesis|nr:glycosyltransferase [Alphaproteobacteria bacterium]MDP6270421.1 glycosyltransferase [Alphaproteobacteria bacterium]HJM51133.1 glycosyltransferase [Alphaproteobacteria bacterium]
MSNQGIKVVHVITGLSLGGAEIMLYKLLSAMDRRAFANRVVSLTGEGEMAAPIRELEIPVKALGMSPGLPSPAGLWRLRQALRRDRPAVVQTWLYHADLMGLVAAGLAGVPKVAWNVRCSDMGESYYRGLNGLVVRALAVLSSRPQVVVSNSQAGRTMHEGLGYHPRRWDIIPNGFDLEAFRPDRQRRAAVRGALGLAEESPLIGMVARYDPVKGQDIFLAAAAVLAAQRPEVHFAVIGPGCDGNNAELAELARPVPRQRLHTLGLRRDIAAVTAALDIASCASHGEGFPNAVGEAMACAVPCAVTNVGDCAVMVGETGRVVPAGDPAALAAALLELVDLGPEGRQRLGQSARQRLKEHYSLDRIAGRYEALYRELADQPTASR